MFTTLLSVLIVLLVLLLFLAALLLFRATIFGRVPEVVEPLPVDANAAVEAPVVAEHLSNVIRLETVSQEARDLIDYHPMAHLQAALESMYPRLHATLRLERINDYSLLYTWQGRQPELDAVALCGHMDVVPADAAEWSHAPFSGDVTDGYVWGRGALDTKSTVITLMEAVESLIKAGYQPERTVYLALGHDEEIGGVHGARCIAEELKARGITLAAVLDEGGAIMQEALPGLAVPVAMVGVAEKGHVSVELRVEGRPGHSSMPPRHTAIGVLARAITRVEANPMPERLNMARLMFLYLGPFLPFTLRMALANTWLFGGLIRKRLTAAPTTNAMIRTSMAATVIQGGVKDNILPASVRAVINCRLMPGDSAETVVEHLRKVIADEAVQISVPEEGSWAPSPVSQIGSDSYQALSRTIRQVFPEVITAPYLVAGATDSRYYARVHPDADAEKIPNVFRFSPYIMTPELLKTVHGVDERIPVHSLERMVQFYMQIVRAWAGA